MTKVKSKPELEKASRRVVDIPTDIPQKIRTTKVKTENVDVVDSIPLKKKRSAKVLDVEVPALASASVPVVSVKTKSKKAVAAVAADAVSSEKGKKTTKKEKKVVTKPLMIDRNGISLAPVRVRNILLNVVFNRGALVAEAELKQHHDELLNAANLKNGYESFHNFSESTQKYIKKLRQVYLNHRQTQFERKRVKELTGPQEKGVKKVLPEKLSVLLAERRAMLKADPDASLYDLYISYEKNFYKTFDEEQKINNLTGKVAYSFYKSLIARDKIRLNEGSKIRLTCFFELALKHFIAQANLSCVLNGNKTVNLGNMNTAEVTDENYLYSIVQNLSSWKKGADWEQHGKKQFIDDQKVNNEDKTKTTVSPKFIDSDRVNPDNKFKFKSYVVDICKYISRHQATTPPKVKYSEELTKYDISNIFGSLSVSNDFKEFCTQVLLELIYNLGQTLRIILRTRKDRTVDKNSIDAVINAYHISFDKVDNLKKTFDTLNKMSDSFSKAQATLKKERDDNPKKK